MRRHTLNFIHCESVSMEQELVIDKVQPKFIEKCSYHIGLKVRQGLFKIKGPIPPGLFSHPAYSQAPALFSLSMYVLRNKYSNSSSMLYADSFRTHRTLHSCAFIQAEESGIRITLSIMKNPE